MSTSPLHAQLAALGEVYIRELQAQLESQITHSAGRIAAAEQLAGH